MRLGINDMLPSVVPTEDLYQQLDEMHHQARTAWLEAQSCPARADEILAELVWHLQHLGRTTRLHLVEATERNQRKVNAADRAWDLAQRRLERALAQAATARSGDELNPHGYYVYLLWGRDTERPLYVGQSTNIYARLGSHLGDKGKRWQIVRVTTLECRTHKHMCQTEEALIARYQPPWNVRGVERVAVSMDSV